MGRLSNQKFKVKLKIPQLTPEIRNLITVATPAALAGGVIQINLVVGRQVAAVSDYKYSKALSEYGKEWTFEELNGYLIKPAKWIKGTKMAFAGLRKEKDRASVILFMNSKSSSPKPLP